MAAQEYFSSFGPQANAPQINIPQQQQQRPLQYGQHHSYSGSIPNGQTQAAGYNAASNSANGGSPAPPPYPTTAFPHEADFPRPQHLSPLAQTPQGGLMPPVRPTRSTSDPQGTDRYHRRNSDYASGNGEYRDEKAGSRRRDRDSRGSQSGYERRRRKGDYSRSRSRSRSDSESYSRPSSRSRSHSRHHRQSSHSRLSETRSTGSRPAYTRHASSTSSYRDGRDHKDREKDEKRRRNKHTFLGAGGGALLGDVILPGAGTLGGLLLGGLGGNHYSRKREEEEADKEARRREKEDRRRRRRSEGYRSDEYGYRYDEEDEKGRRYRDGLTVKSGWIRR